MSQILLCWGFTFLMTFSIISNVKSTPCESLSSCHSHKNLQLCYLRCQQVISDCNPPRLTAYFNITSLSIHKSMTVNSNQMNSLEWESFEFVCNSRNYDADPLDQEYQNIMIESDKQPPESKVSSDKHHQHVNVYLAYLHGFRNLLKHFREYFRTHQRSALSGSDFELSDSSSTIDRLFERYRMLPPDDPGFSKSWHAYGRRRPYVFEAEEVMYRLFESWQDRLYALVKKGILSFLEKHRKFAAEDFDNNVDEKVAYDDDLSPSPYCNCIGFEKYNDHVLEMSGNYYNPSFSTIKSHISEFATYFDGYFKAYQERKEIAITFCKKLCNSTIKAQGNIISNSEAAVIEESTASSFSNIQDNQQAKQQKMKSDEKKTDEL